MSFTMVPVTGTYTDESDAPRIGTVRLELIGPLANGGEIADCQPVITALDETGAFTANFVATDDPDTLPTTGGAVRVTETLEGVETAVYYIQIPYEMGPVDLGTATRVAEADLPPVTTMFQAVNERGLPGGYPVLDDGGRVVREQLPADLGGGEGGVQISGAATDIKPLGTRAAGSSSLAADASHVHQMPRLDQVTAPTGSVSMAGQRLTDLSPGTSATHAATVGQLDQLGMDWLDVTSASYGATGDGTTDDTVALQAALDACPSGGIVYLPQGIYRTSAPLSIPSGVTVQGTHAPLMVGAGLAAPGCAIRPLEAFAGQAVIVFPNPSSEQRVVQVCIDGTDLVAGSSVDGIYAAGNVQNVVLRSVSVRKMTGSGIVTGWAADLFPFSWRLHSVMADNCGVHGFSFTVHTDLSMIDCQAIGSGSTGVRLDRCANSQLSACRAEWSGNYGFHFTGSWGADAGSGGAALSGCATDRNGWDGLRVDGTGNGPLLISGMMTRRDGRNGGSGGGGYAGLSVADGSMPVLVDSVTCYPGTDDNGTGASSPQYGVRLDGTCRVQLDSGYLHAADFGVRDDSLGGMVQIGPDLITASGTTAAPVRTRRYARSTETTVNDLLSDATFFIAHRGGGMEAPEHTMAAYETAVANGVKAIEVSVNITGDGTLVCCHDQTLNRTTDGTGTVSSWTYPALRNTVRTEARPLLGPGWVEQELPTLREVLDRFLGRVVVFLEAKSNGSVAPMQQLLTTYYTHAFKSLVWKAYYTATTFPWATAQGIRTWAYVDPGTTDGQLDGITVQPDMWGVPHTMTDARMQQIVARGRPVICWEVHRRYDVARLQAAGVRGMMCAQPTYVRRTGPVGTTVDWATGVKAPGDMGTIPYTDARAIKFDDDGSGGVHLDILGSAALVGSRSLAAMPPSGYRISFEMMYEGVPAGTEHAGLAFGKVSDDPYTFNSQNVSGGYHFALRGNGDFQLYRHTALTFSGTQLAAGTTTAPVAGEWMTFEVDVTPTQVIVRRTDTDPDVVLTANDTTYRGGYLHISSGSISSQANKPHWRNLSVTPL